MKRRIPGMVIVAAVMASLLIGFMPAELKAATTTHTHSGYTAINSSNYSLLSNGGNFYLSSDVVINKQIDIPEGKKVTLCLNGKTLSLKSGVTGSLFFLEKATLNLYDCKGTGTLKGGTGCSTYPGKGGAIYSRSSTVNMYGGTIKDNSAKWGGAVFIDGSSATSVFNMYGGTICENTAYQGGGGIEVEDVNSTLNLYAGSIINNNVDKKDGVYHKGGGVHFASGKVVLFGTYGDVKITGNTVEGVENNLYLRTDKSALAIKIDASANITSNSSIGISSSEIEAGSTPRESIVSGYKSSFGKFFFIDGTISSNSLIEYGTSDVSIAKANNHQHSIKSVSEVAATCTEDGCKAHYTCSSCGELYKDAQGSTSVTSEELVIEKLGHDWVQGETTAPSIDGAGKIPYTCNNCGETKEDVLHLSINDAKVTAEITNALTYNAQVQMPELKVCYDGAVLSEGTHYTISGNENTNAGSYTLTITGIGAFEGDRTLDYVIKKAPLTIAVSDEEITYGDVVPAYGITYSGFVNGETEQVLSGALVIDCEYTQYSSVGNYIITLSGYESNNYEITYTNGKVSVNPKVVGLAWGNLLFVFEGNAQLPTATATGLVNGDVCTVTVTGAGSSAGVYTATATALSNSNYMLPETVTVEFVIQKVSNADEVTSDDKDTIEESLKIIEKLLSEENAGNLTAEERETLENKKADLEAKLDNINAAENKMNSVKDTATSLPKAEEVNSGNKTAIKDALNVIEDLLSEENIGNLTAEEIASIEEQKAALEEKLGKITAAEGKMETVENTANSLPNADEVTSENKTAIKDALNVIEDLLSEENAGNLTAKEREILENKKADLKAKLDNINATENKMNSVKDTATALPKADEVTSENKTAIKDALSVIESLLAEENVGNLTAKEIARIEEQKAELTEKLTVIQKVENNLVILQDEKNTIPSKDVITTESRDEVEKLLNIIKGLQENNSNNMTAEQRNIIENLKKELQQKMDKILEVEESLNKIENGSATQPDYDDITSENKEDIKDIIENINSILANRKDNLSEDDIEELENQKKELEEKLEFIENIEKYEPVVDDFENATEPEKNAGNGNLQNESSELIEMIPLEKLEKEHVAKGESIKVYLEVTDITKTVTEEDKELIESKLEKEEVSVYLDLTLFKQIGNREPKKVSNTEGMVTITFQVPRDLINQDASITRIYKIVRVHEGEPAILDTKFNEATGEISFETDKFSTYALIYEDVAVKVPQTGDAAVAWPWMLLILGFAMVVFAGKMNSVREFK